MATLLNKMSLMSLSIFITHNFDDGSYKNLLWYVDLGCATKHMTGEELFLTMKTHTYKVSLGDNTTYDI